MIAYGYDNHHFCYYLLYTFSVDMTRIFPYSAKLIGIFLHLLIFYPEVNRVKTAAIILTLLIQMC